MIDIFDKVHACVEVEIENHLLCYYKSLFIIINEAF